MCCSGSHGSGAAGGVVATAAAAWVSSVVAPAIGAGVMIALAVIQVAVIVAVVGGFAIAIGIALVTHQANRRRLAAWAEHVRQVHQARQARRRLALEGRQRALPVAESRPVDVDAMLAAVVREGARGEVIDGEVIAEDGQLVPQSRQRRQRSTSSPA